MEEETELEVEVQLVETKEVAEEGGQPPHPPPLLPRQTNLSGIQLQDTLTSPQLGCARSTGAQDLKRNGVTAPSTVLGSTE